ncbi:MAG: phosphoribosyltransferase family protein [Candidatus Asgardarchaeia archaeon]
MINLFYTNLRETPAIRRLAVEYNMIFEGKNGLVYVDEKPFWVHNGRLYYIYLLFNLTGRFIQYPSVLNELADAIIRLSDFSDVDKILTLEAMGFHIATAVALKARKPFVIAGKFCYRDDITGWEPANQIAVTKLTGYRKSEMFINDVNPGDQILLLDSIISTGGSFKAIINALREYGVVVKDAVAVIEREDYHGVENVEKATGVKVKTLFQVRMKNVKETPKGLIAYNEVVPTENLSEIMRHL